MVPKERSNVPGSITVLPNLFAPITMLNHHMVAISPPNDASLDQQNLK